MGTVPFLAVLAVVVGVTFGAPDNQGREFIVGFMENDRSHSDVELFITTSRTTPVSVRVTAPNFKDKKGNVLIDESFNVTAEFVKVLELDSDIASEKVELNSKGILIEASDEVAVYGTNSEKYSNDGFLALPTDALGTQYYVVTYYPSNEENQFLIVATEDNTEVKMLFPDDGYIEVKYGKTEYSKNDVLSLTMNRFDTFQVQTKKGDLTGTHIKSRKKIAVYSGNVRAYVLPKKTWDHLVEQLPPVHTWGKKFAIVPTPMRTNTGDTIRFVSAKSGTEVKLECSAGFSAKFTIDDRKYEQIDIPSEECCHVEATEGIMVVLFVKSEITSKEPTDPSMILIPPIEQYAAQYVFTTPENLNKRRNYQSYITFVVKESEKDGLLLDGAPFPVSTKYTHIPNTDLVGGFVPISEGFHRVRHESPNQPFSGMLYGASRRESYGMPLGFRLAHVNEPCVKTRMQEADGLDNDCDGLIDEEICTRDNNGRDDDGDGVTDEDCASPPPVDGEWADWGAWSSCSVPSGSSKYAMQSRYRTCTNPAPENDGKQCIGVGDESLRCNKISSLTLSKMGGPDNQGREFIVAFMENVKSRTDVELFITTSKTTPVNVHVTAPKFLDRKGKVIVDETFVVTEGYVHTVELDGDIAAEKVEMASKGILIEADDEITVYGTNLEKYSNDAFLGLPTDVLGTEYYTVMYYPSKDENQFLIVATEDDTRIDILFPDEKDLDVRYLKREYERNDVLQVTMDKLDTFQVQTKKGDLTGTYITATKKIAVFSGNVRAYVLPKKSYDHLVEQLLPVDTWGKKFAIVPTPMRTNTGDTIRFVGAKDGTEVKLECSAGFSSKFTLDSRKYEQIDIPSEECCHVEATEGIMVVLFVKSEITSRQPTDPSMILIPPIEQYAAQYTFSTPENSHKRRDYQSYFTFVIKESGRDGLKLDGLPLPPSTKYTHIPNTELVGGFVPITEGTHTVRHDSPIVTFGGMLYGATKRESYGLPLGLRLAEINVPCIPSSMVVGDGKDNDCDGLIDEELCTPDNGKKDDDNDGDVDEDCAMPSPVDGIWAEWSTWSACSVSCGAKAVSGTKSRNRTCSDPEPAYDGKQCDGDDLETTKCTVNTPCPVDGNWGTWEAWDACSVSCDIGSRLRVRYCNDPTPEHGGADCDGHDAERDDCDTKTPCPIDGRYSDWSSWGKCSVTCGGGTSARSRSCTDPAPQYRGADCKGLADETMTCNTDNCPIDGGFSVWSTWDTCTVTCGGGQTSRSRTCTNPTPQYKGADCVGLTDESQICNSKNCPIDGGFTTWNQWSSCTVTCDGGTSSRARTCTDPVPQNGGLDCAGTKNEDKSCNTDSCPIDGGFTTWSQWVSCTVTCGGGTSSRARTCTDPVPQNGGLDCAGARNEDKSCNTANCPIDGGFTTWSHWSSCTVTCGGGTSSRARTCTDPVPQNGGLDCTGARNEDKSCNTDSCPIDGGFSNWSAWTSCPVLCGAGTVSRSRSCDNPTPQFNGANCSGDFQQSQACSAGSCAVNGGFSDWTTWTSCPVTCGTGNVNRERSCDNPTPQNGGTNCSGNFAQSQRCNAGNCPVDGGFSDWTAWTSCPITCGTGTVSRSRSCDNPTPQYGGTNCNGDYDQSQSCNGGTCPVNGGFSVWNTWSTCTVTCGGGSSARSRTCTNPAPQHGGLDCVGHSTEEETCNTGDCPVDGGFSDWTAWTSCPVRCGTGTVSRSRSCDNPTPQFNGANCSGDFQQSQACTAGSCAVNGGFSDWTTWTSCPVTCGTGNVNRERSCDNPTPQNGGANCSGNFAQSQRCNAGNCPVDGGFSDWTAWTSCPITCGTGTVSRSRACDNPTPQYGGTNCNGDYDQSQSCNGGTCPVNGGFSVWNTWSTCTVTCGGGSSARSRTCTNPAPQHSGLDCVGDSTEDETCNTGDCPVDGGFSDWTAWTSCPVTCGTGTVNRSRSCDNPTPQFRGLTCTGDYDQSQSCNGGNCPVDGGFTDWSQWGTCSLTCGGGMSSRSRTCTNPAPLYGGQKCAGSTLDEQSCNTQGCSVPVNGGYSDWSNWSACPVTCGGSTQTRTRDCDNPTPQNGGLSCSGNASETQQCNTGSCPVDGGFTNWSLWSQCTVTCGTGTSDRSRDCTNPAPLYGGLDCAGAKNEQKRCNTVNCPVDGYWNTWSHWSSCSATCGVGTQARNRACVPPLYGGNSCSGSTTESQGCSVSCGGIVHGNWGSWESWTTCSKTCGSGRYARLRKCDNPIPSGGGSQCTGNVFEIGNCNTQACPTNNNGSYVNNCPSGFFTCQSGSMTCILKSFACDCARDCDDGSDEDQTWASCLSLQCDSGAEGLPVARLSVLLPLTLVLLILFSI